MKKLLALAFLLIPSKSWAIRAIMEQTMASNNTIFIDTQNVTVGIATQPALGTVLDVNGLAQFGTTGKSTFTATGALNMSPGTAITLTNSGGKLVSSSSVTASGFFGNGGGLTNLPASSLTGTVASGNISGSYTGITGVGTLTSGTWNATTVGVANGGTGVTSVSAGQIPIGNGTGALQSYSTFTLTSAGLVGVGTASPCSTCSLHVAGGISVTAGNTIQMPTLKFYDGTSMTTAASGNTGSNNTWTGTNTFNSSATFNGSTNVFQKVTSTTAVNDSCVGFTNLVASTTYVVEARGLRGSAAYMMLQANLDTGANYYGGWRYVNGVNTYSGSVNGGTNIPLGDTVNAFAGSFKARIEVITDQGLVKRALLTNQFTAPNAATDTYYGEGTSGGVYNGSAAFSSLQVCASAGTWSGTATLYRMND